MKLKQCRGPCGRERPLSDFSPRDGGGRKSKCKECRNKKHLEDVTPAREAYARRRDHILKGVKARRARMKLETFQHYSGDSPKCACCGESHLEFLTIDHMNGGGSKHRRELNKSNKHSPGGLAFYYWLRRNNYPSGFQVLCFNCNCAKGMYGVCPHQIDRAGSSPAQVDSGFPPSQSVPVSP